MFSVVISGLREEQQFIKEHLCCKPPASHKQQPLRNWGGKSIISLSLTLVYFWHFTERQQQRPRLRGHKLFLHSEGNWAHCQLQRQIKIRHQFTAGYSWYVLSVRRPSGDKQCEGQTNTLTRYRCCFHAQNQQNRLCDRGAKCQTAVKEQHCCCWRSVSFCSSRLQTAMLPPAAPAGELQTSRQQHRQTQQTSQFTTEDETCRTDCTAKTLCKFQKHKRIKWRHKCRNHNINAQSKMFFCVCPTLLGHRSLLTFHQETLDRISPDIIMKTSWRDDKAESASSFKSFIKTYLNQFVNFFKNFILCLDFFYLIILELVLQSLFFCCR